MTTIDNPIFVVVAEIRPLYVTVYTDATANAM